jgi:GxxExxY protein
MDTEADKQMNTDLLHRELSYKVRGAIMNVANKYGKGLKEEIYQKALAEEFATLGVKFKQQYKITIYSIDTGKPLGTYIPDFVIEDKIILEIKASEFTIQKYIEQQMSYLRASKYELGFLANFNAPKLYIKRSIYTNDRKPAFRVNP